MVESGGPGFWPPPFEKGGIEGGFLRPPSCSDHSRSALENPPLTPPFSKGENRNPSLVGLSLAYARLSAMCIAVLASARLSAMCKLAAA